MCRHLMLFILIFILFLFLKSIHLFFMKIFISFRIGSILFMCLCGVFCVLVDCSGIFGGLLLGLLFVSYLTCWCLPRYSSMAVLELLNHHDSISVVSVKIRNHWIFYPHMYHTLHYFISYSLFYTTCNFLSHFQ